MQFAAYGQFVLVFWLRDSCAILLNFYFHNSIRLEVIHSMIWHLYNSLYRSNDYLFLWHFYVFNEWIYKKKLSDTFNKFSIIISVSGAKNCKWQRSSWGFYQWRGTEQCNIVLSRVVNLTVFHPEPDLTLEQGSYRQEKPGYGSKTRKKETWIKSNNTLTIFSMSMCLSWSYFH